MARTAVLVTGPTVEPVSLEELKQHLRLEENTDNAQIEALGKAARRWCEIYSQRAFLTQTWRLKLDHWYEEPWYVAEEDAIQPPWPRLISVTSITYLDTAGVSQTWDSADYTVDTDSEPGRIAPAYGESYPSLRDDYNAVTITYTAGYGATASTVPEGVKQAVKILAAHWYDQARYPVVTTGAVPKEIEFTVRSLMDLNWVGQYT